MNHLEIVMVTIEESLRQLALPLKAPGLPKLPCVIHSACFKHVKKQMSHLWFFESKWKQLTVCNTHVFSRILSDITYQWVWATLAHIIQAHPAPMRFWVKADEFSNLDMQHVTVNSNFWNYHISVYGYNTSFISSVLQKYELLLTMSSCKSVLCIHHFPKSVFAETAAHFKTQNVPSECLYCMKTPGVAF